MFSFPRYVYKFLAIAYGFSFLVWFGAWYLADMFGVDVLINNDTYFWDGNWQVLLVSVLFAIATLGPFIGAMMVRKESDITLGPQGVDKAIFVAGLLFAMLALLSGIAWLFMRDTFEPSKYGIGALIFALVFFALTSGTEEFGWRGVLYPHIRDKSKSLWDSAFYTGLIWGPWHTPFVLYLFVKAGQPLIGIILSYLGFIMTIVLMSYLHGWINVRGASTFSNYLLHTLHNWLPILIIFIFGEAAGVAALVSIGGYLAVILILENFFSSKQYFDQTESA